MKYKIVIGGDLVPTKKNEVYFINGDIEKIIDNNILNILDEADYRIFNLETPLTNGNNAISKEGPNLKADIRTIAGIKKINTNLLTLANNHILDYNQEGLQDTIEILKENKINFVGAGGNLQEATKGFMFKLGKISVGIYACSEHEYTLAEENKGGANPFDPLNSLDHIQELKRKVDYLIVLYHGGKEFYRYPTPHLQKVCRKIIGKGANLVVCQHSHCIGTYEDYENGKILYGQGNFLFDRDDPINYEFKQTGLLIGLELDEENIANTNIKFYPIRKQDEKIKLAEKDDAKEIMDAFEQRAQEIKQESFIKQNFEKVAIRDGSRYLLRLSKIGTILSAIDIRYFKGKIFSKNLRGIFNLRQRHTLENMLQCEVHNELVREYLLLINGEKNNGKKN